MCIRDSLIVPPDILRSGYQKARRAAGRITDGVVWRGPQQLHHHFPNMLGGAELAVLARSRQLAQHILVQIALHLSLIHILMTVILPSKMAQKEFLEPI